MARDRILRFRIDKLPAATGGHRTKAKGRRKPATSDRSADRLERLRKEITR